MHAALKWFDLLPFPIEWRAEIEKAINGAKTQSMAALIENLEKCENTQSFYNEKGIPHDILLNTLADIAIWSKNHYLVNGEIGVSELSWLSAHLSGQIFRLGRLQFKFGKAVFNNERLGLKIGDNIIEVHIPQGEKLTVESAKQSFELAFDFFQKFFPNYKYHYFTCESWMLDVTLRKFLPEHSNILKFGDMFDRIACYESNQALRYLFELNLDKTRESSLQKGIREHLANGGRLYETYGVIPRERAFL